MFTTGPHKMTTGPHRKHTKFSNCYEKQHRAIYKNLMRNDSTLSQNENFEKIKIWWKRYNE